MKCTQCRSNEHAYETPNGTLCPPCLSVDNRKLWERIKQLITRRGKLREFIREDYKQLNRKHPFLHHASELRRKYPWLVKKENQR